MLVLRAGDRTSFSFGTSFAAPQVAAAAALVISAARRRGRELASDEVKQIITSTARAVNNVNPGLEGQIGAGVLDVSAAIQKVLT
jgi:subtilisin family serine protease